MTLELGIMLGILAHFGAIVWWGSKLTTTLGCVVETLRVHARQMEHLQQAQTDLLIRMAVQENLTRGIDQG